MTTVLTFAGTTNLRMTSGPVVGDSAGSTPTISLAATASGSVKMDGAGDLPLTIIAGTGVARYLRVEGVWASITHGAPTDPGTHEINATVKGTLDLTGPLKFDINQDVAGVAQTCILRGSGIEGVIHASGTWGGTNTAIAFVACADSHVHATVVPQSTGGQAYSFDASSTRNILEIAGVNTAAGGSFGHFTTASTDSGTGNRVITEAADTFLARAAVSSPSLLMGELAAVQSGVTTLPAPTVATTDNILKDMTHPFMFMGG